MFFVSEFEKWKKEIEETNKCQYVSKVVERKLKHANCVRREYFCHRSYSADIKTSNRKRSVKSLGSNKMGCVCPSRIIVDIKGKLLNVTFFEKHIGHECEIVRTRIPKDERAKIAGRYWCIIYRLIYFIPGLQTILDTGIHPNMNFSQSWSFTILRSQ